jgi:hypothetical protein
MQERRQFSRKPLAVLLEMYSGGSREQRGKGFITNLSEKGAALETSKTLYPGEKLLLRFRLPNEWKFDILGEIVYAREGVLTRAYGARFYLVSNEDACRLQQYLETPEHHN